MACRLRAFEVGAELRPGGAARGRAGSRAGNTGALGDFEETDPFRAGAECGGGQARVLARPSW